MTTFRAAVEAGDLDAVEQLLADDVTFRSPVAFKPYRGRPLVAAILRAVFEVFEDFRYVREYHDGADHALVFEATVDGLDIAGCDFLTLDDDAVITELTVMVRPLKAAQALSARMAEKFAAIQLAAGG